MRGLNEADCSRDGGGGGAERESYRSSEQRAQTSASVQRSPGDTVTRRVKVRSYDAVRASGPF